MTAAVEAIEQDEGGKVHSGLGPSSAHRWINCTGSPNLVKKLRATGKARMSGIAAAEGNAAHDVLEMCLKNNQEAWEHIGEKITVETEKGSMSFDVTSEMSDAVQVAIDWTRETLERYKGMGAYLLVERRVASPADPDAFGTSDIIIVVPNVLLVVGDFKYGIGVVVEPDDEQTRSYGQYTFETFVKMEDLDAEYPDPGKLVFEDQYTSTILYIIQPRIPHPKGVIRKHETNRDELNRWFYGEVLPAMQATRDPNAPLAMGDWCRFCPASDHCPLIHRERDNFKVDQDPVMLTDADLNAALVKLEQIEKQGERLKEEMFLRAQKGAKFEDWKLVRKMANRVLKEGGAEAAQEKWGDAAFSKPKMLGVPDLEKLEGGKAFVSRWAMKPDSGLTMAKRSDKRDEVDADPMAAVDKEAGVTKEEIVY